MSIIDWHRYGRRLIVGFVCLLLVLECVACSDGGSTPTMIVPSPSPLQPTQTPTPFQPSPTPQSLAARVNGEAITLAQFQSELARYQAVVGTQLATEDEQRVLQEMVDQLLLEQAAEQAGFTVDDDVVHARVEHLVSQLGNDQALVDWIASHGYTQESFRRELARSIAVAWMRDQLAGEVPDAVEQVHARQILLYNSEDAAEALNRLSSGADFATLAAEYDPLTKGDLGWFPRGYLLDQTLEEVAFKLQPGERSDIIETAIGFHILQVIERDPAKPLEQDARLALQSQHVEAWLAERRAQSDIQILLP
jgi:parvulin-like peptidyl-prolyl isomerase